MPASAPPSSVAILGGGISGLAAAVELNENHPNVDWQLFEASPRLGGVLETVTEGDWQIELSADNFLTRDPWCTDLCRLVGIETELLPTATERRGAMVVCRGKVTPVPEGFVLMAPRRLWQMLISPVLSPLGKLRLACEPFIRSAAQEQDESVGSFTRRRLGQETLDRLVQPLVGGIYTADPEKLSLAATLPQFIEQEQEFGSLWRANRKSKRSSEQPSKEENGASYSQFLAPKLGMQQLVDAIKQKLPRERIHTNRPVAECVPNATAAGQWKLFTETNSNEKKSLGEFDAVISALPAYHSANVVEGFSSPLATALNEIYYASSSVVCLGVRDEQISRPVDCFGFVVPKVEGRQTIATSFSSYKFPGRTPEGCTLIRTFVGGAMQPELADLPDEQLIDLVREELGELIGLQGEPMLARVARWPRRMPQYHVGHLELVRKIEQLTVEWPGLALAGAAYRGVGVPQCIRSGQLAVEKLMAF